MKNARRTLVTCTLLALVLGGVVAVGNNVGQVEADPGDSYVVTCQLIEDTDMAADRTCYTVSDPAQLVGAAAECDTAASNAVGVQVTNDRIIALTPQAAGAGVDLLGRISAAVTPTGLYLTNPASLAQFQAAGPPVAQSTAEAAAIAGHIGIFNPTAVANGDLLFKPGDSVGLDFSAVPTAAAGCVVSLTFQER